ncbi:MAG: bifunctional serine/threonine-protein kinase/formylglycine-generating enzyme family protein [Polyangiaceae bacterium]
MADLGVGPGTIVGDDFEIVKPLSSGGMGSIWVARQLSLNVHRALKLMHSSIVQNAEMRERFVREARIGASVGSDHVVQVINAGVDRTTGIPWMAMELLDGVTLAEHVPGKPPIPRQEMLVIWVQLCAALAAAHQQNIVHRDIKPENIFLARSRVVGMPFIVKVLDFGIAKIAAENVQNTLQAGSPLYMAPEQTSQSAVINQRTDVWALGLMGFLLLTGRHFWKSAYAENVTIHAIIREAMVDPIPAASVRAAEYGCADRLPPGFDDWFGRCVVRNPEGRLPDARVAGDELLQILGSEVRVSSVPMVAEGMASSGDRFSSPVSSGSMNPARQSFPDRSSPPGSTPSSGPASNPASMPTGEYLGRSAQVDIHHTPIGAPPMVPMAVAPTTDLASATFKPAVAQVAPPPRRGSSLPIVIAALAGGALLLAGAAFFLIRTPSPDTASGDPIIPLPGATSAAPSTTAPAAGAQVPEGMVVFKGGDVDIPADVTAGFLGRKATVAAFALDANEVTARQYKDCIAAGKCTDASADLSWDGAAKAAIDLWSGLCTTRGDGKDDHPVNCVTWDQAKAYCEAENKRLPTEEEWHFATHGLEGRPQPWGSASMDLTHANLCDQDCVTLAAEVKFRWQPYLVGSDSHAGTAPVGSFKPGDSPDGVHDLLGNVSEWTSSRACDTSSPGCDQYTVVGGGCLTAKGDPLHKHTDKTQRSPNVGFRCAVSR